MQTSITTSKEQDQIVSARRIEALVAYEVSQQALSRLRRITSGWLRWGSAQAQRRVYTTKVASCEAAEQYSSAKAAADAARRGLADRREDFIRSFARPALEQAGKLGTQDTDSVGDADMDYWEQVEPQYDGWDEDDLHTRRYQTPREPMVQNWLDRRHDLGNAERALDTARFQYGRELAAHLLAFPESSKDVFDSEWASEHYDKSTQASLEDRVLQARIAFQEADRQATESGQTDLPFPSPQFADRSDDEDPWRQHSGSEGGDRFEWVSYMRPGYKGWVRRIAREASPYTQLSSLDMSYVAESPTLQRRTRQSASATPPARRTSSEERRLKRWRGRGEKYRLRAEAKLPKYLLDRKRRGV